MLPDPFALALAARYDDADAALDGRRDPEAEAVRAWVANARGEFDRCLLLSGRALRRAMPPSVRVRLLMTAASASRQQRRYTAARRRDTAALSLAPDHAARAHALIGLAADSVGDRDPDACEQSLRAAAAVAPRSDWRVAVRLGWVRCEHALMTGRPGAAATASRRALASARRVPAPRHEAKSLLFLGVAQREAGQAGWRDALGESLRIARLIGAAAIEAVAAAELGPADAPSGARAGG